MIPEILLIQNICLSLNFFRKTLTNVDSAYHQSPPPSNTPNNKNIDTRVELASPKTDAPANIAPKKITAIGLDKVRKKIARKSPNIPLFPGVWDFLNCFIVLVKNILKPTKTKNIDPTSAK